MMSIDKNDLTSISLDQVVVSILESEWNQKRKELKRTKKSILISIPKLELV